MDQDKSSKRGQPMNTNISKDTVEALKFMEKHGLQVSVISPEDKLKQNAAASEKVVKTPVRPIVAASEAKAVMQNRFTNSEMRLSNVRTVTQTTIQDSKTTTKRVNQSSESKGFGSNWNVSSFSSESKSQTTTNRMMQNVSESKTIVNQTRTSQMITNESKAQTPRNVQNVMVDNKGQRHPIGLRINQQMPEKIQRSSSNSSISSETKMLTNQVHTSQSYVASHGTKSMPLMQKADTKIPNQMSNKLMEAKTPGNRSVQGVKLMPANQNVQQRFINVSEAKMNVGNVTESKMVNSKIVSNVETNSVRTTQHKTVSHMRTQPNICTTETSSSHVKVVKNFQDSDDLIPARPATIKRGTPGRSPTAKKKCVKRLPPNSTEVGNKITNSESGNLSSSDERNEDGNPFVNNLKSRPAGLTITPVRPNTSVPSANANNRLPIEMHEKEVFRVLCRSCNNYSTNSKWCQVCKCPLQHSSSVQSIQQNEMGQKVVVTKNVTNVMVSKQIIINNNPDASFQYENTVRKKIFFENIQTSPRSKPRSRSRRKFVEPVCLTLSSDDEFDNTMDEDMSSQPQMFTQESEGSKSGQSSPGYQEEENQELDEPEFPGVTGIHPDDNKPEFEGDDDEEEEKNMNYEVEEECEEDEDELDEEEGEIDDEEEVPPEDDDDEEEEHMHCTEPLENLSTLDARLRCRSVRIGSYKVHPQANNCFLVVHLAADGLIFKAPIVTKPSQLITITIKTSDISLLLFHFGKCLPIIFIFTTPAFGECVRKMLNMASGEYGFFDPASADERQKKITLLIDSMSEDQRRFFRFNFPGEKKVKEIDQKTANEILVKSTPSQPSQFVRCEVAQQPGPKEMPSSLTISPVQQAVKITPVPPQPVKKLITYPAAPLTGGITITTEDLACLNEGEFLNDAIIDFYLKYVFYEKLSEELRDKTHIFSSYFYHRLTLKPERVRPGEDGTRSVKIQRHDQVKTWTRHVDIFSKDFIIIPVNLNVHWFVAIICYPGLVSEVPNTPEKTETNNKPADNVTSTNDNEDANKSICKEANISSEGNCPNSDENSTSSNSMFEAEEPDCEEPAPEAPDSSTHPDKNRRKKEVPCICIFDSLTGSRARVAAMLRDYLEVEWRMRKGTKKAFNKESMPGHMMQCPQQTNYSDCGVYLLQYVESFYENPIPYFDPPVPNLTNWFSKERVSKKRQELKDLILSLQKSQLLRQAANTPRKSNASDSVPS